MIDASSATYIVVVVFAATAVRSALGFGEALIAVPLLALRLPIVLAAPLAVEVSVIVAFLIVVRDWRHVEWRSAGWLIAASFLGIPVGLCVLTRVNDHLAKAALGAIIAVFGAYGARGMRVASVSREDLRWLCGTGFVAGVLGGAYGMNGPPLAVYGALRGWSPQQFRATLQGYFFAASVGGLVGYASLGLVNLQLERYFVLTLPSVIVGIVVGRAVAQRMRAEQFVRAVYTGLVAIGLTLVVESLLSR